MQAPPVFYQSRHSNKYAIAVCLFFVSLIFVFVNITSLIVCGFVVIKPTRWAENFKNTTCEVMSHRFDGREDCSCGSSDNKCYSSYPCIAVIVKYKLTHLDDDNNNQSSTTFTSQLHVSEYSGYKEERCTVVPTCSSFYDDNREEVYEYLQEHLRLNTSFSCLYNPEEVEKVILKKIFDPNSVTYCMAIPGVFLAFSLMGAAASVMLILQEKNRQQKCIPNEGGIAGIGADYPRASPNYIPPPPPPPQLPGYAQPGFNSSFPPPPPGYASPLPGYNSNFQSSGGAEFGTPFQQGMAGQPPPPPPYGAPNPGYNY